MCCRLSDPKCIVRVLLRLSLGFSFVLLGVTHLRDPGFANQAAMGLGPFEMYGFAWGFILPSLFILGGVLLVIGIAPSLAVGAAGLALASIPVGLLLKSAMGTLPLESAMPAVLNALVWMLALAYCVPRSCCSPCQSSCECPPASAKSAPAPAPKKTVPSPAPTATVAATPSKKVAAKPVATKSIPVKKQSAAAPKGGLEL